jgi:hypothetical protein
LLEVVTLQTTRKIAAAFVMETGTALPDQDFFFILHVTSENLPRDSANNQSHIFSSPGMHVTLEGNEHGMLSQPNQWASNVTGGLHAA